MKRGQITVFIILGLLIVLAVGSIIYLNSEQSTLASIPQVQQVAEEAKPVQNYITECVDRIAVEGLNQIGSYGGYLSAPGTVNPLNPTESDALSFSLDGSYAIPYWWYLKSENTCDGDCSFSSKKPNLYKRQGEPSIEGALESYVDQNLNNCLKQFEALNAQGIDVTSDDERKVRVFITNDNVAVSVEQTFQTESSGGRNTLDSFVTTLPVRLKDIYDLSTNITVLEAENAFLGKHSRELIASFSGTESEKLPPVGSVEMELGPGTIWVKSTVRDRIQTILQSYVPILQVFGTRNYRPIEVPANIQNPSTIENVLNRNALIPQLKAFPQMEARFTYLSTWTPYFDLNCDGQICRPESMINSFGPTFGLQRYSFAYDLSYPVVVEIREPDALNGKGYTFRFALEGNLRNNEPLTADWESLAVNAPVSTASQLCDESQRTSGEVAISLIDTVTRKPVDGAVTFDCGGEACNLGQTIDGKLNTSLPRCLGGRMSAVQADYLADVVEVDSATDDAQSVELAMNPYITVDVSAKKYQLRKDSATESWQFNSELMLFSSYDQAIISMTRENQDGQTPVSAFSNVCGSPFYKGEKAEAKLTPGNYTVSLSTLYHGNLTIPVDTRCIKIKKYFDDDEKCFNIPSEPINFGGSTQNACVSEKPFPTGNVQYQWELTPEMLRNAKTITFPTIVLAAEIPGTRLIVEDLSEITKTQAYADGERTLIKPEVRS